MARDKTLRALGLLALMAFVVHALNHVRRGEAHDVLWVCNLSPLLLALGCFLKKPMLVAVPLLWLCFGTPMWILDMATGGELIWTSFLPHLGGIPIGILAIRRLGFPKRAWLYATLALVGVMLLSRLVTPPEANVNLAFSVWKGWERWFPRYELYFVVVLGGSALTFALAEKLFRKFAL
jgi:hypothetical protein